MLAHARAEYPNECCGLLTGLIDEGQKAWRAIARLPLVNEAASPVEYFAAASLLHAEKERRRLGHELLAIYHSHPASAPIPSCTDLERSAYYTHVIHFIVGLQGPEPLLRGWWLSEDRYEEAAWQIVDQVTRETY